MIKGIVRDRQHVDFVIGEFIGNGWWNVINPEGSNIPERFYICQRGPHYVAIDTASKTIHLSFELNVDSVLGYVIYSLSNDVRDIYTCVIEHFKFIHIDRANRLATELVSGH